MCGSGHGMTWLYCGRSPCKFSGLTCFGLTSLLSTGTCRSIESQQGSDEHWLERQSLWRGRSQGLVLEVPEG